MVAASTQAETGAAGLLPLPVKIPGAWRARGAARPDVNFKREHDHGCGCCAWRS